MSNVLDDEKIGQDPNGGRGFSIDLLPGSSPKDQGILGTLGGGLFTALNAPFEIVAGEIGQKRLQSAVDYGDTSVDRKYIDMVVNGGMSVSDVADRMADDGVAITGGVAHDLMLNIFMDPFNLMALGYGATKTMARRASNIQSQFTNSAGETIADSARRQGVAESDVTWLTKGPGRQILGKMYSRTSSGYDGIKRAASQAAFGRVSGPAFAIMGLRIIATIDGALSASKVGAARDALGIGMRNFSDAVGGQLVVRRTFGRQRRVAMDKVAVLKRAGGPDSVEGKEEFMRLVAGDGSAIGVTQEAIDFEWDYLWKVWKKSDGGGPEGVLQDILTRDTAGEINERVGRAGATAVSRVEAISDEAGATLLLKQSHESLVTEKYWVLSQVEADGERIAIARNHFIANLEKIVGADEAAIAWRAVAKDLAENGGDSLVRALSEVMVLSDTYRLGATAKSFAAAKRLLRNRLFGKGTDAARKAIDATNPMVTDRALQAEKWSLVADDTMTDLDFQTLTRLLGDETLTVTQKAQVASAAVYKFSYLRNLLGGGAGDFARLAANESTAPDAIRALENTLGQLSPDDFVKQVPIDDFRGVDDVLPEVAAMRNAADEGGYKLMYEPTEAASTPRAIYQDMNTRDIAKFGVDLWTPITDDVMDVALGNRNKMGRIIDFLNENRTTSILVANTLARMQEYVVQKGIPLSRSEVVRLHKTLTNLAIEQNESIRTVTDRALKNQKGLFEDLALTAGSISTETALKLRQLAADGTLRQMVFWAAQGDLRKVGVTRYVSGGYKASTLVGSKFITQIADKHYPQLKFALNGMFNTQEIIESKWWNGLRGVHSTEWRIKGVAGMDDSVIRFGSKRTYDVIDPITGKKETLDAVDILTGAAIDNRQEIKFAQEMGALNMYFSNSATDAILKFGAENEGFSAAWRAALKNDPGPVKNLDYAKYVAADGLDKLAEEIAPRFERMAPEQWKTWLEMAGGDRHGAVLLMLRDRQQVNKATSTARLFWQQNKGHGIGFGRQYDDAPIKRLDVLARTLKGIYKLPVSERPRALKMINDQLSLIHADLATIGYTGEGLAAVRNVKRLLQSTKSTIERVSATGTATKKGEKTLAKVEEAFTNTRGMLRSEFEGAVARKKLVRDELQALGISKPQATDMAALFVVAERRGEMLPLTSQAVRRLQNGGEALTQAERVVLKDHLIKIKSVRVEEETLWNAVSQGIESIQARADKTHYFDPNQNFIARSINHPVLALYPAAYMFGKVLPEYAKFLFSTPTKGVGGLITAPWRQIMRGTARLFGKDINPAVWGNFAPLTGWKAAFNIRMKIAEGEDPNATPDPLSFLLIHTLIPGIPTDIGVAFPRLFRTVGGVIKDSQDSSATIPETMLNAGIGLVATGADMFGNIVGAGRGAKQVSDVAGDLMKDMKEQGGLLEMASQGIRDMVESATDIIQNK
jgi:hypothetical protein